MLGIENISLKHAIFFSLLPRKTVVDTTLREKIA